MKIYIYKALTMCILIIMSNACVSDDDFSSPLIEISEPILESEPLSLTSIYNSWNQTFQKELDKAGLSINNSQDTEAIALLRQETKLTFEPQADGTSIFVEAYVVSSDRASNFFEELVVQDTPSNPTIGIRVLIDENPLFTYYELGRKIYIKLDGLTVGIENGVFTLGILSGNQIENISAFLMVDTVLRSTEVATITPKVIRIDDFSDELTNLYIKIEDLQFSKNQILNRIPMTFAGEPSDEFDGERFLESCQGALKTILSTSTFADFKGLQLSTKRGSFEGILTKNFFGDTFNLVLNDPTGLQFDNEERCDPEVLECTGTSSGNTVIFEANFTNQSIEDLENTGWINQNVTQGDLVYEVGSFSGNSYAQITGFRSGEDAYEVWLVTPEIVLDATTQESLSFDIQSSFDNGTHLTVWVTQDFNGNITTTNWEQLDANIPSGPSDAFGDFEPVSPISIDCLEGTIRIGFKYLGGDPSGTTRYHIDNLEVVGE